MTQKRQDEGHTASRRVSITKEDVDRMLGSYVSAHPGSLGSEKVNALKEALHEIEQGSGEAESEHNPAQRPLTSVATALSGSGALGLVAAALAPELPIVTIGAAIAGYVVSRLLAHVVDNLSE